MWVKAYVEEKSDGLVEILVKAHKGFYKLCVHPDDPARVEVMIDGVLKGRAKTRLKELESEKEDAAESKTKVRKVRKSWSSRKRKASKR